MPVPSVLPFVPACPAMVTAAVAPRMVRARVAVPVPPALVALSVTAETPTAVGVPVMTPVAVLTLNPAGRPVALYPVGDLLAVIV